MDQHSKETAGEEADDPGDESARSDAPGRHEPRPPLDPAAASANDPTPYIVFAWLLACFFAGLCLLAASAYFL